MSDARIGSIVTHAIRSPRRVHVRICLYWDRGYVNGRPYSGDSLYLWRGGEVRKELRRLRMARKRRRGWA